MGLSPSQTEFCLCHLWYFLIVDWNLIFEFWNWEVTGWLKQFSRKNQNRLRIHIQSRSMSDLPLSSIYFKKQMAWVRTTLKRTTLPRPSAFDIFGGWHLWTSPGIRWVFIEYFSEPLLQFFKFFCTEIPDFRESFWRRYPWVCFFQVKKWAEFKTQKIKMKTYPMWIRNNQYITFSFIWTSVTFYSIQNHTHKNHENYN